jgi:hypothetical protein
MGKTENMGESPNHMEPLKTTNPTPPIESPATNPKTQDTVKKPVDEDKKDQPIPGEPVLGSDHGPWKGTD